MLIINKLVVVMRKLWFRCSVYTCFIVIFRCIQTLSLTLFINLEIKFRVGHTKTYHCGFHRRPEEPAPGAMWFAWESMFSWQIWIGRWQHHDDQEYPYCDYCERANHNYGKGGYPEHREKTRIGDDCCQWASSTRNQGFHWGKTLPIPPLIAFQLPPTSTTKITFSLLLRILFILSTYPHI